MDDDKGWDEYDDCDDDLSDENEEDKKDEKNNEYINQKHSSSNNGYNKSNNNGYYGYNNNYSYGCPAKKYRKKKGNKKYYSKENESQFTNKNRQYNKDSGSGYKNISHDFVNTNSNYMRNQNTDNTNHKNYNSNTYGKGRSYTNRDKNSWGFYGGGKKTENEVVSKPMFINSKLKNNGNPEGNFVKIDVNPEEKKHFSLTNIGEVNVNDNQSNSILAIKSLLVGKEPEKEIKISEEKTNENKNNEIESKAFNNNSFNNDNSSSLPWRSGSGAYFGERGCGGYKKDYYSKTYRNNKKDNSYYYSSGKNYNKNRYSLNQPQSKRSNKFD